MAYLGQALILEALPEYGPWDEAPCLTGGGGDGSKKRTTFCELSVFVVLKKTLPGIGQGADQSEAFIILSQQCYFPSIALLPGLSKNVPQIEEKNFALWSLGRAQGRKHVS